MAAPFFKIDILDMHWMKDSEEELDLCAHGHVRIKIGDETIVDRLPEEDDWTVSAAALHLLRTLENDHQPENSVGNHLIPHCGFSFGFEGEGSDVYIYGCFEGINYWVKHRDDDVHISTDLGTEISIPFETYKKEVLQFVDSVKAFYDKSLPKLLPQDGYDRKGYNLFWAEWNRRRDKWETRR